MLLFFVQGQFVDEKWVAFVMGNIMSTRELVNYRRLSSGPLRTNVLRSPFSSLIVCHHTRTKKQRYTQLYTTVHTNTSKKQAKKKNKQKYSTYLFLCSFGVLFFVVITVVGILILCDPLVATIHLPSLFQKQLEWNDADDADDADGDFPAQH